MKKTAMLIAFGVLLYVGTENLQVILSGVGFVWGLLFPFILGGAIAFVMNVPMKFLEEKFFGKAKEKGSKAANKLARPVSLVLALVFIVAILLLVVLVVAPALGDTLVSVAKQVEKAIPQLQRWAQEHFRSDSAFMQWIQSVELDIEPAKVADSVMNMIRSGADNILSSTFSITMGIVNTVTNVGIGFIFACYILLAKEKLAVQMKKALYAIFPVKTADYLVHVCALANKTFSSFVTGQCIEAVILGSMFFVSMTVFRFPYALLVGVLISFTALIPIFGGFIGCWVGFFLILIVNPVQAVMFLGLFLILQQIEGNFIYPHVVGGSVGLPSIWVLMAVTVGGSLMGIVGMLIFIPLVSVLYALFRDWTYGRLRKKGLDKKF